MNLSVLPLKFTSIDNGIVLKGISLHVDRFIELQGWLTK